ncbi:MAG: DUF1003 domain-containing protein [Actinomycetota bacterium]|jgi:uncharacterized membrane protein|nr:DUF1003 domain-containing protein [Actinomycetota bacterium]
MVRDDARDDDRREPGRRTRGSRISRLDVPKDTRRVLIRRPDYDPEMFGRFAETFARFMGTARFLFFMTVFVIIWLTINIVGIWGLEWDPYPFILLNLLFSTQASYAAPLILLAQNRQESRDRVIAEQDREVNVRAHADMEYLAREVASLRMAVGEVSTRDFLRSELRNLLTEMDERAKQRDDQEVARQPPPRSLGP